MEMPYKKELVGGLISVGGENLVYRYGRDRVIKFPIGARYFLDRPRYCDLMRKGLKLYRSYFHGRFPETELYFFGEHGERYVIIQRYVRGRPLRKEDIADAEIKTQLQELFEINGNIWKEERYAVDFFGGWELLFFGVRKKFDNIIVEEKTNKLCLVDFGIFGTPQTPSDNFFVRSIETWAVNRQHRILKKMFSWP